MTRPAQGEEGSGLPSTAACTQSTGPTLFLRRDDGRVVVVDISKLDPSTRLRFRPGSSVAVVAVPVGNKFQM
jgi:hypothetical protein